MKVLKGKVIAKKMEKTAPIPAFFPYFPGIPITARCLAPELSADFNTDLSCIINQ